MIRRANKRAGNSIEINGERKKKRGRLFSEEPRKTLRSETLPVAVLECVLSRDTGLTGKEGWKSVFPSHELHSKPGGFFFLPRLTIFFTELPVWLGLCASRAPGASSIGWFAKVRAGRWGECCDLIGLLVLLNPEVCGRQNRATIYLHEAYAYAVQSTPGNLQMTLGDSRKQVNGIIHAHKGKLKRNWTAGQTLCISIKISFVLPEFAKNII